MNILDERRSNVRAKLATARHDAEIAALTKERNELREALKHKLFTLGMLRSVILSGESWTQEIEESYVGTAEIIRKALANTEKETR